MMNSIRLIALVEAGSIDLFSEMQKLPTLSSKKVSAQARNVNYSCLYLQGTAWKLFVFAC
jgi:hypothetical protein